MVYPYPVWVERTATRTWTTAAERKIVKYGLSPWSYGVRCDYCDSRKRFLVARGIPVNAPLVQVGRWMLHEACAALAAAEGVEVLEKPPLDYRPLAQLTPPVQIAVMKIGMLEAGASEKETR